MTNSEINSFSPTNLQQQKFTNFDEGELILIDKPLSWSSFDVVKKIRNTFKIKKIGHAGTLDPLATGLLIMCTGKKTKTIEKIQSLEKEYLATICLGGTTVSYDREHEVCNQKEVPNFTSKIINQHLSSFIGTIQQKPPLFSAIKKNGKRLFDYARAGEKVKVNAREITIHSIELIDLSLPYLTLKVICSKGTYIRSLANDIGYVLNTGGYLYNLKRTRIGNYKIENAYSLNDFLDFANK